MEDHGIRIAKSCTCGAEAMQNVQNDQHLQEWAVVAQERLTQMFRFEITLHRHTESEVTGPCPLCKKETGYAGTDRFIVYEDGNYWCRYAKRELGKEHKGWWLEQENRPTPEQIAARKLKDQQEKLQQVATMLNCQDWQAYHSQVDEMLWLAAGLDRAAIDRWGLGYCKQAPCTDYETPSLTIPVFRDQKLVDIRHRLLNPKEGQKYRSHKPGLPAQVFNADSAKDGEVLYVVEGEKKAIVLEHNGFHPTIAYPGQTNVSLVKDILLQDTRPSQVIFLPDPGTQRMIIPMLKELSKEGVKTGLVDLFEKPDDLLLVYGVDTLRAAVNYPRSF